MKNLIIAVIIIGGLVGGYFWVSKYARVTLTVLEGELVESRRGDLVVPITASGNIRPASVTQIKGEASGEVVEIPFEVGQMVRKGQLIVRLDESDEERNVIRAEADYKRAELAKARAESNKAQLEGPGILLAEAKIDKAEAVLRRTTAEYEFKQPLTKPSEDMGPVVPKEEWKLTESTHLEAQAALKAAKAELSQTNISVEQAELEIKTAEQNVHTAKKTLEDAEERLRETKVYAPIDGMILAKHIQIGEIVLSGKTSLTGGTVLVEIADVSDIYAVVNVDEADIGMVREIAPPEARPGPKQEAATTQLATFPSEMLDKNELVEVTVESLEDKFYGIIERISPQSEIVAAIATFKVWIRITSDNRNDLIGLINTQAEAKFTAKSVRDVVLVSYDAIQKNPNGEGFGVYVPVVKPGKEKPESEFRRCKFGVDNSIDVAVLEGLEAGQKVYTKLPQKTEREKKAEEEAEEE